MADTEQYNIKLILDAVNNASADIVSIQADLKKLQTEASNTWKKIEKTSEDTISTLKKWLAKLWITAAIYKVWQAIRDLSTAMEPVENSFYRLSETAWIAWDEMLEAMRKATLWTVSDYWLMEQANKAYALWVVNSIDDMTTLMEIARLKWQAMWRSMEEALWDIVTWLWRASPLILDNLWIVIKQWEAQEKYAQSIWKTVDQLTEAEKKQALVNAVVEQWKIELEQAWEVSLTTQERFNQFQASLQNIAVWIWQQLMPIVNDYLDSINTKVSENSSTIANTVSQVIYHIARWIETVRKAAQSIAEAVSWVLVWAFTSIRRRIYQTINWFITAINWLTSWINNLFWTSIWQISKVWEVYTSEVFSFEQSIKDTVSNISDIRDWYSTKYREDQAKMKSSTNATTSAIKNMWSALNGVSWWWSSNSWSNKTSDRIKEIKDQYELLTYNMDEQYKKLKEVNEERKKWFDEIEDKFNEADKNVKNLTDDVNDLKKSLSDLNKSETSDVATEFVKARKELEKMERDYAWIWAVASQYSLSELENYQHWWIWKYDIDALIQYKKYSDELESVYAWLNAWERKAMDEQIAYQERYQSLNGIEKIKEDYRIKREEIQSELDTQLSALKQEELKRAEIDKQMKQYQKEWLAAIDKEIVKYGYMVAEKKRYEKEYMDQLEIDYKRQQQMYDDLIRKAKELAKVRSETWWPDWTRANGWPVYSWQQYLVWEHWPELFIPSQNWKIVRNEDLWKWQEFTINVNMWWVVVNDNQDTSDLANTIAETITRQLELYKKGIY